MRSELLILAVAASMCAGCASMTRITTESVTVPVVPFSKVMNPAFAKDYQDKPIRTTVKFIAAGQTEGYMWGAIPKSAIKGKVPFRVVAPGESEPTGLGNIPPHVFIEKSASDIVFELKSGDEILLTGHTVVGKMFLSSFSQIVFVADSVSKTVPISKN
jgi:hypothetical protein